MDMYNKIFTKILDSSVWLEPTPTRIVWITMIAAMDETGFCPFAAVGNVAGRARVTEPEAKKAIDTLEAPDPESSDQDNEGRRIERVPGGWMVLNAQKYRALVTKVNIQDKTRERVRRFREKKRTGNAQVTEGNAEERKCNDSPIAVVTTDLLNNDLSVMNRVLCEKVGIFEIRQQSDMHRCLASFVAKSGKSLESAVEFMAAQWESYKSLSATEPMQWTWGSAYKFFMSGKWENAADWPLKNRESDLHPERWEE